MTSACYFTISTLSHIRFSEVFFESASRHSVVNMPESFLFLLGSSPHHRPANVSNAKIIDVESIISSLLIKNLIDRYTPAECCWALKPLIFQWLIEQYDSIFYFDSDILITGPLDKIVAELGDSSILLTPHYLVPFGSLSTTGVRALSLLRGGVFNAGFLGLRRSHQARIFLSWWAGHVSVHGRNDPDNGMCGDQRWLDLVPVLFADVRISRHPGLNVGYWNIHERIIIGDMNDALCNGQKLLFLHFSGFEVDRPQIFSKHLPSFIAKGTLADFCSLYSSLLNNSAKFLFLERANFYAHKRWWHKFVEPYRFLLDFFHHPRSS